MTLVARICQLVLDNYHDEKVAQKCVDYIQSRAAHGHYRDAKDSISLAQMVAKDLVHSSQDKHFKILKKKNEKNKNELLTFFRSVNFGFERVEIETHGPCYVLIGGFLKLDDLAREAAVNAMQNLKKASPKALIVDLRSNGGGSPEMVQFLCSYFVEENVPLNILEWRHKPTQIFNSLPYSELPKEDRLLKTPLYILTSHYTFSAAEEFANNLKELGRAVIVGEISGGGANPGDEFDIGEGLKIFISTGKAVNPYTRSNWEGKGVIPHYSVASEEAYKTAIDLILSN